MNEKYLLNVVECNRMKKNCIELLKNEVYYILYNETDIEEYFDNTKCSGPIFDIYNIIFRRLNKLTYYVDLSWSEKVSYDIVNNIVNSLNTLNIMNKLDDFSNEDIYNFIIINITYPLENEKNGILDDFFNEKINSNNDNLNQKFINKYIINKNTLNKLNNTTNMINSNIICNNYLKNSYL